MKQEQILQIALSHLSSTDLLRIQKSMATVAKSMGDCARNDNITGTRDEWFSCINLAGSISDIAGGVVLDRTHFYDKPPKL